MTEGIIQKVFSPYLSTVTMHPMTYEDLERLQQELIEEIKKDCHNRNGWDGCDANFIMIEKLIGDSQRETR